MAVEGLNHYNLRASRELLVRLRDWYRDVVGLEEGDRPPLNHYGFWLYGGGSPILHLSESRAGESNPAPGSGTFDHVSFTCSDAPATRARLEALGVPYRAAEVPTTRQRQLFLRDPAGNGVELNFPTG